MAFGNKGAFNAAATPGVEQARTANAAPGPRPRGLPPARGFDTIGQRFNFSNDFARPDTTGLKPRTTDMLAGDSLVGEILRHAVPGSAAGGSLGTMMQAATPATAPAAPGAYPWSEATRNYVNPHFDASQVGRYSRFDPSVAGAGLTTSRNPALAFDQMFGSGYVPRMDVPQQALTTLSAAGGRAGLGGAAYDAMVNSGFVTPASQRALEYNARYDRFAPFGSTPSLDEYYAAAFQQAGLTPADISSLAAINAIDPETKANVIDMVQRMKMQKNLRPKRGIGSSLPGQLLMAGMGAAFGAPMLAGAGAAAGVSPQLMNIAQLAAKANTGFNIGRAAV